MSGKYKNAAERVCLYGILSALCIVLGYVESLIPLDFAVPGIKLGLANAVTLTLAARGDVKGAFAVNTVRILLSGLLFSSPAVLIYSLSGGIASLAAVALLSRLPFFGSVGLSVSGAAVHNLTQLLCAAVLMGRAVWYYAPFLLLSAAVTGFLTGLVADILLKKFKARN